jgi:hypothetical protein
VALLVNLLTIKLFWAVLVTPSGYAAIAFKPQGTVAQPTMCFKCFCMFGKMPLVGIANGPIIAATPLFALI